MMISTATAIKLTIYSALAVLRNKLESLLCIPFQPGLMFAHKIYLPESGMLKTLTANVRLGSK
jgi:hypothetical protein